MARPIREDKARTKIARRFLPLVAAAALAQSCNYGIADVSSVPDHPTYNGNIYPLFVDHCLLCHGSPPQSGAPSTFRLDSYNGVGDVLGVIDVAASAVGDVRSGKMPPAAKDGDGVGPNGLRMLENWQTDGYPQ